MAHPRAAWGVEIGAHAIKAIRLDRDGDEVSVSDFVVIPHKKVLTTPDVDQDELIRLGLGQFISQKSLEGEHLVMSVPGHAAFARFAKLPPVEPKKVPDIVKFEAVQQIPFPIEEVEWDYQTFASDDSPEIEVGIFAITRDRVQTQLNLYGELGLTPESLTLSPVAVHNAMAHDQAGVSHKGPVMYLDIGTQATDVIITEEGRCWIRTFPLGGTHFTEAIASAFKLSYSKAEKLKLEASTSKYAKQIMQAMRPVFSDLLQDLQRSIGYYQSLHRDADIQTVVGLGSTFKIPGLRKFIGQQLQVDVQRLDEYRRISVSGREAASFAEHAVNMATAYGLALQGVGLASIDVNLVPVNALREQIWHQKTKWFAAAAVVVIAGAALTLVRPIMDQQALEGVDDTTVQRVLSSGTQFKNEFEQAQAAGNIGASTDNMVRLLDYRRVWPYVVDDSSKALAAADPQPELLSGDAEQITAIAADARRLVALDKLSGVYSFDDTSKSRRIEVTLNAKLSHDKPIQFLSETVAQWLRDAAKSQRDGAPYRIVDGSVSLDRQRMASFEVNEDGKAELKTGDSSLSAGGRSGGGGANRSSGGTGKVENKNLNIEGMSGQGGVAQGTQLQSSGKSQRRKVVKGSASLDDIGAGGGAMGAGQGAGAGAGANRSSGFDLSRSRRSGASQVDEKLLGDLDEIAPIPAAPEVYKPKDRFYIVPITFTIEIIDPHAPPRVTASAVGGSADSESSS